MKICCRKSTSFVAVAALTAGAGFAQEAAAPKPVQQESTALTLASGVPRTPEQEATRIDEAVLRFRIDPAKRELAGDATLRVRATKPLERLVIDLDNRFRLDGIDVDGKALRKERYRNPEGRLEIDLPKRLAADRPLALRIRYGGEPCKAKAATCSGPASTTR
jgi:aminopeptidase N